MYAIYYIMHYKPNYTLNNMKYIKLLEQYITKGYTIEEALAKVDHKLYNELYKDSLTSSLHNNKVL